MGRKDMSCRDALQARVDGLDVAVKGVDVAAIQPRQRMDVQAQRIVWYACNSDGRCDWDYDCRRTAPECWSQAAAPPARTGVSFAYRQLQNTLIIQVGWNPQYAHAEM